MNYVDNFDSNDFLARLVTELKGELDNKKAIRPVIIDVKSLTSIADYMLIADAKNDSQLDAMKDAVYKKCLSFDIFPRSIEGSNKNGWIVMDYNEITIHLFLSEQRKFYDLERIWGDGRIYTD